MKKLSMLVTVVMVLALAVPAFAGVDTAITGKVGADVRYDQQDNFHAVGKVETNIKMTAGSDSGDLKAVVSLGTTTAKTPAAPGNAFGSNPSPFITAKDVSLSVKYAYVEATGALIKGGSDITTKLGSLAPSYNDWVGDITNDNQTRIDGLELSGIDLGAASLTSFYGWLTNGDTLSVLSANGSLDVIDVNGVYVSEKGATAPSNDYAVSASASPADGVSLSATFAGNGANNASAYKVGGELTTMPNLTLGANVWSTAAAFAPMWANHTDDDPAEATTAFTADQKGYELTAETTQSGVDLSTSYKSWTDAAGNNAKTKTVVSGATTVSETDLSAKVTMETAKDTKIEVTAKKSFGDINGSYKLTSQGGTNTHEIGADTTVNTPIADGVKLAGTVELGGGTTDYGVDASWTAPNGINLGVGYANFDRTDDWAGGYDVTNDANGADGLSVWSSVEVSF